MTYPYYIAGGVFLLLSVFVAAESFKLRFYTPLGPGPGFFPLCLSVVLGFLSLMLLAQATLKPAEPMPADFFPQRSGWWRIGAIVFALIGTALLLDPLGFRITTFAFYAFLLFVMGYRNVPVSLSVAFAGSFGIYLLFSEFLKIPLPVGILGI